jgi:hypothetical protein
LELIKPFATMTVLARPQAKHFWVAIVLKESANCSCVLLAKWEFHMVSFLQRLQIYIWLIDVNHNKAVGTGL